MPFQQIAERHVLLLGHGFQHLQHPFLHAHSGLYALDYDEFSILLFLRHGRLLLFGTNVPE